MVYQLYVTNRQSRHTRDRKLALRLEMELILRKVIPVMSLVVDRPQTTGSFMHMSRERDFSVGLQKSLDSRSKLHCVSRESIHIVSVSSERLQ